jgi:hypothetical protein
MNWARLLDSKGAALDVGPKRAPQRITGMAASPDGGVFIAGDMVGTLDFGMGSVGVLDERALFLARYDAAGELEWVKLFPCDNNKTAIADIAVKDGLVVIAGEVEGALTLDIGSSYGNEAFIAQFTSDGAFVWQRFLTGVLLQTARAVAYSQNGKIVVAGEYEGPIAGAAMIPLAAANKANIFVAKLFNANGAVDKIWGFGDSSKAQRVRDVTTTFGNDIVLVGNYAGAFPFPNNVNMPNANTGDDAYITTLTPSGEHKWHISAGNLNNQYLSTVTSSPDSTGIYTAGCFLGDLTIDGQMINSGALYDLFVMKIVAGSVAWGHSYGNEDLLQFPGNIATNDALDRVLITASCAGAVDFGAGLLSAAGAYDPCFVELDKNGNHLWSAYIGGDDMGLNDGGLLWEVPGPAAYTNDDAIVLSLGFTETANLLGTEISTQMSPDRVSLLAKVNPPPL